MYDCFRQIALAFEIQGSRFLFSHRVSVKRKNSPQKSFKYKIKILFVIIV